MTIGSAPMTVGSALIDVDIQRMAAEVQVDASRTIVAVGVTPGAAAKGWRTIDLCLLKPDVCHVFGASYRDINGQKLEKPIFYSNLVGQKAEDVILVGFDYKTGNAEMKKRAEVESRIGGPYLPLRSTEGHFADTVEQELQRFHGPALPPEEVNFGGGGL